MIVNESKIKIEERKRITIILSKFKQNSFILFNKKNFYQFIEEIIDKI